MQVVIDIPEDLYGRIKDNTYSINDRCDLAEIVQKSGTPLPKECGDLFSKTEILRFLECPKYENCRWKNCFDCNESRCINLNNVNKLGYRS